MSVVVVRRLAGRETVSLVRRVSTARRSELATRFWAWTTQRRPSWRESPAEAALLCTVFALAGSSSVAVIRPVLKKTTGIEGSLVEGPWSYRIVSLVLVSPMYTIILVATGTAFGRHRFFAAMSQKTLTRFLPPSMRPKDRICKNWWPSSSAKPPSPLPTQGKGGANAGANANATQASPPPS